jgi:hypothetical protein
MPRGAIVGTSELAAAARRVRLDPQATERLARSMAEELGADVAEMRTVLYSCLVAGLDEGADAGGSGGRSPAG